MFEPCRSLICVLVMCRKIWGTASFVAGFVLVLLNWGLLGIGLEAVGIMSLYIFQEI
jgi:hypothetical protein